jgi:hypothetical protein
LQAASAEAVAALQRNLSCGVPATEVGAAKIILDFTLKARELFDYGDRIRALEAKLTDKRDGAA